MSAARVARRMLLVAGVTLAATTPVHAQFVVMIPPSGDVTGETDWGLIQGAFLRSGPGTEIQLEAGQYYLDRVVLAEDFRGTFRGAGKDLTVITTVGELDVTADDPPWLYPPSLDNPWPAVITFVDGDFILEDMTFQILEPIPMTINVFGDPYQAMHSIIAVAGGETGDLVRSTLREVGFEGALGTFGGYNVIQAVYHEGLMGDSIEARGIPLTGRHVVSGCTFETLYEGNAVYNIAGDASLLLRDNTFEDVAVGVDVQDSGGRIILAENQIAARESEWGGDAFGLLVNQGIWTYFDGVEPAAPLSITVRDNDIQVMDGVAAIYFEDWQHGYLEMPPSLFVNVLNNNIMVDATSFGVFAFATDEPRIQYNLLHGNVLDIGIALDMATFGRLTYNNMQDLIAGVAPCMLGESTYANIVIMVNAFEDLVDLTDDPDTPVYDGANRIVDINSF